MNQSIPFKGLAAEHMGIAMWQADGSGPEPRATGHSLRTPIGKVTTHYYIASRDFDDIDPQSHAGFIAVGPARGFERLSAALPCCNCSLSDVTVTVPLTSAGRDREGVDWVYRRHVEIRYLAPHAPLVLALRTEPIVALPAPRLILTENYVGARTFSDVSISLVSDDFDPMDLTESASAAAKATAHAFLEDVAGRRLRLVVDTINLVEETFHGGGRIDGRFADLPSCRLEVAA